VGFAGDLAFRDGNDIKTATTLLLATPDTLKIILLSVWLD
jgi:hypothetical protein